MLALVSQTTAHAEVFAWSNLVKIKKLAWFANRGFKPKTKGSY